MILIALIGFAAALIALGAYLLRHEGAYVLVTVNGEVYGKYALDTDMQLRVGNDGAYNLLVIESGSAYIREASCRNQLCVHQGRISHEGRSLVCLPNRVVVEIVGGERQEVDAVAG
jgi:hypothetical protein